MPQQQLVGQVFPIQLEWLGGRSTFQQSQFSARNARICLEDMKESEQIMPVILEKHGAQIAFRTDNQIVSIIDLDDIVQVHCFPKDPSYAVFEIIAHTGSARFEVVRAPGGESLKSIHNFLFTYAYANQSLPVLPVESNNESTPPVPDAYEAQEPTQPATNGIFTPEFQIEEGYEEVAVNRVGAVVEAAETLKNPLARAMPSPVEHEEEEEEEERVVEEVDKTRSSPSTTSVSSDSHPNDKNPEIISDELLHSSNDSDKEDSILVEEDLEEHKKLQQQQEKLKTIEVSKPRKFGKLQTLTEIIAEEKIDTKHYQDDGRLYVVSKKAPKLSNSRPPSSQASGFSESHKPNKYVHQFFVIS